jgi:hypothetical protein
MRPYLRRSVHTPCLQSVRPPESRNCDPKKDDDARSTPSVSDGVSSDPKLAPTDNQVRGDSERAISSRRMQEASHKHEDKPRTQHAVSPSPESGFWGLAAVA